MPQTVDGVEGEGSGEDELSSVLDGFGEIVDKGNDVLAVEGSRSDEIGDTEGVEHCEVMFRDLGHSESGGGYAQTLRPAPVTRLAMEPSQVSWGW